MSHNFKLNCSNNTLIETDKLNTFCVMNKGLHQTIMIRPKLRNKFLKSRSFSDKSGYNKQRNACVSQSTKTKKNILQS